MTINNEKSFYTRVQKQLDRFHKEEINPRELAIELTEIVSEYPLDKFDHKNKLELQYMSMMATNSLFYENLLSTIEKNNIEIINEDNINLNYVVMNLLELNRDALFSLIIDEMKKKENESNA